MRKIFICIFFVFCSFISRQSYSTPITDILFIQNKELGEVAAKSSQEVAVQLEAHIVNLYDIADSDFVYDKNDPEILLKMVDSIYDNGIFKSRASIASTLSKVSELSDTIEKIESIIALKKILGDTVSAVKSAKTMFAIAQDARKIKTRYRVFNNLIAYGTGNRESLYQLKLFLNSMDDVAKSGSYLYETYQFITKVESIEETTNKGVDAIRYLLAQIQSEIAHEMRVNLASDEWAKLVIQDFILKRWKEAGRYNDYIDGAMLTYIRDESCLKLLEFGCKVKAVPSSSVVDERELDLTPLTFHLTPTQVDNEVNKYLIEIPPSLLSDWGADTISSIKFTEMGDEFDFSSESVGHITYLNSEQTPASFTIQLNENNLFYSINAAITFNSGEEYLFYNQTLNYISTPDSVEVLEYPSEVGADSEALFKVKSCGDFLYGPNIWFRNARKDKWFQSYLDVDNSSTDDECYLYTLRASVEEFGAYLWGGEEFEFYISGGTQVSNFYTSVFIDPRDTDNDGMEDLCEDKYFKGLQEKSSDDFDKDNVTNVEECLRGTDPTKYGAEGVSKTEQINNRELDDGTVANRCRLDDIYFSNLELNCSYVTLYEDVTIWGDLSVTSNTFDLNGYRLIVGGQLKLRGSKTNINKGEVTIGGELSLEAGGVYISSGKVTVEDSFIHSSGTLDMSGGTLIVKGDYRIQKADENTASGYTYSDGILRMENPGDYLLVEGDFFMDSRFGGFDTDSSQYRNYYNGDWLTAGVLELKGDFTQLSSAVSHCNSGITKCNYYSEHNFQASGTHKVVLSGTELQHISFSDPSSGSSRFNVLEIKNISQLGVNIDSPTFVVGGLSSTGTPIEGASNINIASLFLIQENEWPYDLSLSGSVSLTKDLAIVGNLIIKGGLDLKEYSLSVDGDVTIDGGSLELTNASFDLSGSILQKGGTVNLGAGSLEIQGDYRIQKTTEIEDEYTFSEGVLRMEDSEGYLLVEGDFFMDSKYGGFDTGSTYNKKYNGDWLTAGVLELKGDFTQLSSAKSHCSSGITDCNYYSEQNFQASGTHKVVLSGTELQSLRFADPSSGSSKFNILDVKNNSEEGVVFESIFVVNELYSADDSFVRNVKIETHSWILSDNQLVKGDLFLNGKELKLNGHTLTVEGDIYHSSGTLDMSGGTLIVKGDYRIQKADENTASGYTYSDGILRMENPGDYLLVEGDFFMDSRFGGFDTDSSQYRNYYNGDWLTAGVLELKGDFTQLSSAVSHCNSGITKCNYYSEHNFQASGTHKVVLSGTELQHISFSDPSSSRFNELEIQNNIDEGVIFLTSLSVGQLFNHNQLSFILNDGGAFPDFDGDGYKDNIDTFPLDVAQYFLDSDKDGIPDLSDPDNDNDGVLDVNDAFPLIAISTYIDTDNDGAPNECGAACVSLGMGADADDDNDGVLDIDDAYPLDPNRFSEVTYVAKNDVDGDGKSDLLWRSDVKGWNFLWAMDGIQTKEASPINVVQDDGWLMAGQGDYDADGKSDIFWRNTVTGLNFIYLMDGFNIKARQVLNYVDAPQWELRGSGDFNADGKGDVLWRRVDRGDTWFYMMDGLSIGTNQPSLWVTDLNYKISAIGDINGDGTDDVIWRHQVTGINYIWIMENGQIANRYTLNAINADWSIAGAGDLDGDGTDDIILRNQVDGRNWVYLMEDGQIKTSQLMSTVADTNWQIANMGDYDGDGKTDILWRDESAGRNIIHLMDGLTIKDKGVLRPTDNTWTLAK
ncbi:FG-GAP-like repeat-containing protein [Paraglaciecola sp. L3A3]|uniref:FG-GAP-like repeat-containing protein n=1 Tax=Paraglaciecola sp. L3A3 TaxID=2686358 RepID=UPI00131DB9E4|nr:FG-GAP-like repeat-containing protein [Paraglaciecola sp. L3A3]